MAGRYIPQDFDFLGSLRERLFGLSGFKTLALELIQNAEDAKAEEISFDFTSESLIVENSESFKDKDFERMRSIGSGGKREEEDSIGTFGIGFVSVYQITDHPELVSSGKHWIFYPDKNTNERIWEENTSECSSKTTFVFPWAFDNSEIRIQLEQPIVSSTQVNNFRNELTEIIPHSLIFLKNLKKITILDKSKLVLKVTRAGDRSDDKVRIQVNDRKPIEWIVYRSKFERNIEGNNKSNDVFVAITNDPSMKKGLLFAYLPTKIETTFPFHLSADFYPTSDRKGIVLDGESKAEWNRRAIQAVVDLIGDQLLDIRDRIDFAQLYNIFDSFKKYINDNIFGSYWESIKPKLLDSEIVFNSTEQWKSADDIFLLRDKKEESYISTLAELNLNFVHPKLRPYYSLLREIGVQEFQLTDLVESIRLLNINSGTKLGRDTKPLVNKEKIAEIYQELELLFDRDNDEQTRNDVLELNIGLSTKERLYKINELRKLKPKELELFTFLLDRVCVADELGLKSSKLISYIPRFRIGDVIAILECFSSEDFLDLFHKNKLNLDKLYEYFSDNSEAFENDSSLVLDLKRIPMFLSHDEFKPLNELSLPGNFVDPLNLDILIQDKLSGKVTDFLKEIGVKELELSTYCSQHLPRIFVEYELNAEEIRTLVHELASNFSKIKDDRKVLESLKGLKLVECDDGEFRIGKEVYFDNPILEEVLSGINYTTVVHPGPDFLPSYKDFYKTIGVTENPKSDDILKCIKDITKDTFSDVKEKKIKDFYNFLSSKWDEFYKNSRGLDELKRLKWLPSNSGDWKKPSEIFLPYRKYLFESQAEFLSFNPEAGKEFNHFLEIESEPDIQQVVDHVIYCSEHSINLHREVYRFLNDNAEEPETKQLCNVACINIRHQEFVKPNQVYWYENPFPNHRFTLSESLKDYLNLFQVLGVKDKPDFRDYISIIIEISDKFGSRNAEIDEEDLRILNNSFIMMQTYLINQQLSEDSLTDIKIRKVIPQADRLLYKPAQIFFDDKPSLTKKLQKKLKGNTIPRDASTHMFLERLGVRYLSDCVERNAEYGLTTYDASDTLYLRSLIAPIKRYIASRKSEVQSNWDENVLQKIEIFRVDSIQVNYVIEFEERLVESGKIQEVAFYDSKQNKLILVNGEKIGSIPSAKEIAHALNGKEDVSEFVPLLKEILNSGSSEKAQSILDNYDIDNTIHTNIEDLNGGQEIDSIGFGTESDEPNENITYREFESEGQSAYSSDDKSTDNSEEDFSDIYGPGHKLPQKKRNLKFILRTKVISENQDASTSDYADRKNMITSIDRAGITKVLEYEKANGREPKEMPLTHEGYDIESYENGKISRYIEVKSTQYKWNGFEVEMSDSQFYRAQELGDKFFLYVVDEVFDVGQVYEINNPANRVTGFLFDSGWKDSGES